MTVFERSRARLQGRGGGIATPMTTFKSLLEENILDAGFPHTVTDEMPFVGRAPTENRAGHTPWSLPIDLACFHWGTLWENLRKRVPDEHYLSSRNVVAARMQDAGTVVLELEEGETHCFDLVLFADGYRSLGRQLCFPETSLSYRGYVLWRGVLPESRMSDRQTLGTRMVRISYPNLGGHMVAYLVPGFDGSVRQGERLYNWGAYIPAAEDNLQGFLTDRNGVQHSGSLPPGSIRPELESRLKQLMADHLPAYYADIVSLTDQTYIQPIYTIDLPGYARDRIGLLGDAGILVQPHTASGIFKGINNAEDLIQSLLTGGSVEESLAEWSRIQTERGKQILELGEQIERALIWEAPNFSTTDTEATQSWWESSVKFPDGFAYRDKY